MNESLDAGNSDGYDSEHYYQALNQAEQVNQQHQVECKQVLEEYKQDLNNYQRTQHVWKIPLQDNHGKDLTKELDDLVAKNDNLVKEAKKFLIYACSEKLQNGLRNNKFDRAINKAINEAKLYALSKDKKRIEIINYIAQGLVESGKVSNENERHLRYLITAENIQPYITEIKFNYEKKQIQDSINAAYNKGKTQDENSNKILKAHLVQEELKQINNAKVKYYPKPVVQQLVQQAPAIHLNVQPPAKDGIKEIKISQVSKLFAKDIISLQFTFANGEPKNLRFEATNMAGSDFKLQNTNGHESGSLKKTSPEYVSIHLTKQSTEEIKKIIKKKNNIILQSEQLESFIPNLKFTQQNGNHNLGERSLTQLLHASEMKNDGLYVDPDKIKKSDEAIAAEAKEIAAKVAVDPYNQVDPLGSNFSASPKIVSQNDIQLAIEQDSKEEGQQPNKSRNSEYEYDLLQQRPPLIDAEDLSVQASRHSSNNSSAHSGLAEKHNVGEGIHMPNTSHKKMSILPHDKGGLTFANKPLMTIHANSHRSFGNKPIQKESQDDRASPQLVEADTLQLYGNPQAILQGKGSELEKFDKAIKTAFRKIAKHYDLSNNDNKYSIPSLVAETAGEKEYFTKGTPKMPVKGDWFFAAGETQNDPFSRAMRRFSYEFQKECEKLGLSYTNQNDGVINEVLQFFGAEKKANPNGMRTKSILTFLGKQNLDGKSPSQYIDSLMVEEKMRDEKRLPKAQSSKPRLDFYNQQANDGNESDSNFGNKTHRQTFSPDKVAQQVSPKNGRIFSLRSQGGERQTNNSM